MIKKLARHIGVYKRDTIITPILMILEVFMDIIIPFLMALIIDKGLANQDMPYIYRLGGGMLLASLMALAFGVLSGVTAAKASSGFAKNLRQAMYYRIQEFSFANIDKYSTASLITRLTTDVSNVQNAFQMMIRLFVRAPIMLISAVVMCFFINKDIAIIFLIAVVLLGTALYLIMTGAHKYFMQLFRKYDDLNGSVQENLTGIRVVKAYVREEYETKRFNKAADVLYNYAVKAENILVLNNPLMQFTMYTLIMLLSWLGARLIVSDGMTTGELMSLFTYATTILISLMIISMLFVMVAMAKSSADRIVEVLEEQSTLANPETPITYIQDGSVEFEDVDFSYGDKSNNLVLSKINITIESGETIGIIGETGSGKSSLVQLIPRLYDVKSGSVKVGGVDVREYDLNTLREGVSMVLQKNTLFSGTIRENLKWGNKYATEEEIIEACKQAQAHDFIQAFPQGYDTYIERGGTNVSGGQKQRICIARALLKQPKILILDDSTSAVDTKTDSYIRKAFKEDIPNTTKIIIAQRISSIQDADRIIVLSDGKIHGCGTHEELLENNSIYQEVYESQVKGADSNEDNE